MPTKKLELEINQIHDYLSERLNLALSIAICGKPKAGKGSIKNKFLGKKNAHIGVEEGHVISIDQHKDSMVSDLPGVGTSSYSSVEEYFRQFKVGDYDLILYVVDSQISDVDAKFIKKLRDSGKKFIIIRNKADDIWQHGKTLDELKDSTTKEIQRQLQCYEPVIYTSCRTEAGFEDLEKAIEKALPYAKAQKWMILAKARTKEQLAEKKDACFLRLWAVVAASAGNGWNPDILSSMAIDQAIMSKFFADVRTIYNLDDDVIMCLDGELKIYLTANFQFLIHQGSNLAKEVVEAVAYEAFQQMSVAAAKEGAKQGGKLVAQQFATRLIKWLPVVGPIASSAISGAVAFASAKNYIEKCNEAATKVMEHELGKRFKQ